MFFDGGTCIFFFSRIIFSCVLFGLVFPNLFLDLGLKVLFSYCSVDWTLHGTGESTSNSPVRRPPVGVVYSSLDVQSIW